MPHWRWCVKCGAYGPTSQRAGKCAMCRAVARGKREKKKETHWQWQECKTCGTKLVSAVSRERGLCRLCDDEVQAQSERKAQKAKKRKPRQRKKPSVRQTIRQAVRKRTVGSRFHEVAAEHKPVEAFAFFPRHLNCTSCGASLNQERSKSLGLCLRCQERNKSEPAYFSSGPPLPGTSLEVRIGFAVLGLMKLLKEAANV